MYAPEREHRKRLKIFAPIQSTPQALPYPICASAAPFTISPTIRWASGHCTSCGGRASCGQLQKVGWIFGPCNTRGRPVLQQAAPHSKHKVIKPVASAVNRSVCTSIVSARVHPVLTPGCWRREDGRQLENTWFLSVTQCLVLHVHARRPWHSIVCQVSPNLCHSVNTFEFVAAEKKKIMHVALPMSWPGA